MGRLNCQKGSNMKMRKIGELNTGMKTFTIYIDQKYQYRLYRKYYNNGWHKNLIKKFDSLYDCNQFIGQYLWWENQVKMKGGF